MTTDCALVRVLVHTATNMLQFAVHTWCLKAINRVAIAAVVAVL
jgi:hypothetical protein